MDTSRYALLGDMSPVPTTPPLGRLKPVPLRDAWESESGEFTPWLAREENIQIPGICPRP